MRYSTPSEGTPAKSPHPYIEDGHAIEFVGAFESTYLPLHDVDVMETTRHDRRWRDDLELLRSTGVTCLRYPVRWHRVEASDGELDWSETDRVFSYMREAGLKPIVDLVHHTSYPSWLGGFDDPLFGAAFVRYCEAFAARYPWVEEYTLFNEPFATLFLSGHEGVWPPYGTTLAQLVQLFRNVMPAVARASRSLADLLPEARHVYVDTCESHAGTGIGSTYAAMANDRRHFLLDLFLGRPIDPSRPFARQVEAAGGSDLFDMEPGRIDVLGLDYYAHSEWWFDDHTAIAPSPRPAGLSSLILEYHRRYPELDLILSETNIRGFASDRATWLKYTLEQCENAMQAGAPLTRYCWFPFIDSMDWDSLLARPDGHVDPVGVYWIDDAFERRSSSMSRSYALAARGAKSCELPAYRFQPPVDAWIAGLMPQMSHWEWQDPPPREVSAFRPHAREVSTEGVLDGSTA